MQISYGQADENKKNRKEYLKKREAMKLEKKTKLLHPKERTKKVGGASQSISTKAIHGDTVSGGYKKKRSQAAKKGQVAIPMGAQFGAIEEGKKNENN